MSKASKSGCLGIRIPLWQGILVLFILSFLVRSCWRATTGAKYLECQGMTVEQVVAKCGRPSWRSDTAPESEREGDGYLAYKIFPTEETAFLEIEKGVIVKVTIAPPPDVDPDV